MCRYTALKRGIIPRLTLVLALPVTESLEQVIPGDHRIRVLDQLTIEESRQHIGRAHPLSLSGLHHTRRRQNMLAGGKVRHRAFDSPCENSGPSLRGFQLTQKVNVLEPLLLLPPLLLIWIQLIYILVVERENGKAALDCIRALVQAQLIVRAHHERVSSVKCECILVLVLALHSRRRCHLLESVTAHLSIGELLKDAQAHTAQVRSGLQEGLTVVGDQQGLSPHVRILVESPANGCHEDTLTIGTTAEQDRHCSPMIIRLVAGEGTAHPSLEPCALGSVEGFQGLVPRGVCRTRHVLDIHPLRHVVLGVMRQGLASAQVNDACGRACQTDISVELRHGDSHKCLNVHEDTPEACIATKPAHLLNESIIPS